MSLQGTEPPFESFFWDNSRFVCFQECWICFWGHFLFCISEDAIQWYSRMLKLKFNHKNGLRDLENLSIDYHCEKDQKQDLTLPSGTLVGGREWARSKPKTNPKIDSATLIPTNQIQYRENESSISGPTLSPISAPFPLELSNKALQT